MVTKTKKKVTKKATKKKTNLSHGNAKFDEKLIPIIKNLAYRGKTYSEIAELLDITAETLKRWRDGCEELQRALDEAKGNALEKVERALFERAVGYACRETKVHMTKSGVIKTREVIKHYPPSETAIKYYLGNKDPKNWKETNHIKTEEDPSNKTLPKFAFTLHEDPDALDARGGESIREEGNESMDEKE